MSAAASPGLPNPLPRLEPPFRLAGRRVWVAGHRGMVGAALVRRLAAEGCDVLTVGREALDLRRQAEVEAWMAANRPEVVFLAAATVGGIEANRSRPAEFLGDNLAIESNVIQAAHLAGVEKLMFLGSACVYPRLAAQPMAEEALLTGPLEPTNEWYAVAKIAGIKLCQAYRQQYGRDYVTAQPINVYGPGDSFDTADNHVIPALMARAHAAKTEDAACLTIWGSGAPLREFIYVDDLADALVFLTMSYSGPVPVNIGTGQEISTGDLARQIAAVVGFTGEIAFDTGKPDGVPRKLLDSGRLAGLGWTASTPLSEGLRRTYDWFLARRGGL